MNDVISVIIPVYNVSSYLPACLDSVLNQDYPALEVIVIDDGSTDGSAAICDAYASRDVRVKVIHQKNAGAAAAKNAGLRMATGEYLSFVDSDDFLEPNVYGYLLGLLQAEKADAVQCAFRDVYRTHTQDQVLHPGRQVLDNKAYLLRFPTDWSCALLWNKLYKRRLFEGVLFEEGHKIDDEYFTYQGFLRTCNVVLDDRVIYNYRKRFSSVMNDPAAAERRMMDSLDALAKRHRKVKLHCPDLGRQFDESYLDALGYMNALPGSTPRTVAMQRRLLRRYLAEKGNTFPPKHLWRPLAKMYFTRPKAIQSPQPQDGDAYFA